LAGGFSAGAYAISPVCGHDVSEFSFHYLEACSYSVL
jgi:hypothetical protein